MADSQETPGLTLGIISCFAWLLPIVGLPLSIIGLVRATKGNYVPGKVLNLIGLCLSIVNAVIGVMISMA